METTGVFTSAANAQGSMAVPLATTDTSLPRHFPWLSTSSAPRYGQKHLSDDFSVFAKEVWEWAESTLAAGVEVWPDEWSDK